MQESEVKYQVQLPKGLSRNYTTARLRRSLDEGVLTNDAVCTPDRGNTWCRLGDLLSAGPDVAAGGESQSLAKLAGEADQSDRAMIEPQPTEITSEAESNTIDTKFDGKHEMPRSAAKSNGRQRARNLLSFEDHGPSDSTSSAAAAVLRRAADRHKTADTDDTDSEQPQFQAARTSQSAQTSSMMPAFLAGLLGGAVISGFCAAAFIYSIGGMATAPETQAGLVRPRPSFSELPSPVAEAEGFTPPLPAQSKRRELLQYSSIAQTSRHQAAMQDMFGQYAQLVRTRGADGRRLDAKTVELFSGYMTKLMEFPGTSASPRSEAVHDLAEKCKLLYLLQLANTRSDDPAKRQRGLQSILKASNSGLRNLYLEFAAGDLKYMDIFDAADPKEQSDLIMIRYWYYRSADVPAADEWLEEMIAISVDDNRAYISESILEADNIER